VSTNDAPLTDAEIAALARAGYADPMNGELYIEKAYTRAEWRTIIADLPDYWSPASRAEIRAAVATLHEAELRELLESVLDTDDPAHLVATLRGAAFGLAARVRDNTKEGTR